MLSAKLGRNVIEVGDDVIAGQLEVSGDMGGQRTVAPAGQQLRGAADPSVTVERHGDVDVIQELRETR